MNYSNIEGRLSKSSLDRTIIDSSHFDSDNVIIDPSDHKFIGNAIGHCFGRSGIVFDLGWFDDHRAIEVAIKSQFNQVRMVLKMCSKRGQPVQ